MMKEYYYYSPWKPKMKIIKKWNAQKREKYFLAFFTTDVTKNLVCINMLKLVNFYQQFGEFYI